MEVLLWIGLASATLAVGWRSKSVAIRVLAVALWAGCIWTGAVVRPSGAYPEPRCSPAGSCSSLSQPDSSP